MNDRNRRGSQRAFQGGKQREDTRRENDNLPQPTHQLQAEKIKAILEHKPADIDQIAAEIAQNCRDNRGNLLPPTQMRNFYGPIVRLRSDIASISRSDWDTPRQDLAIPLSMHSTRLLYMAARDPKAAVLRDSFRPLISTAIQNNAITPAKVITICDFAEAVVAHHYALDKKRGGSEE
jgi:CRISPR/Cas system CSM-associated protein Csm2 small subunit